MSVIEVTLPAFQGWGQSLIPLLNSATTLRKRDFIDKTIHM